MKKFLRFVGFIFLCTIGARTATAQSWSGIFNSSSPRAITWTGAGLAPTITYGSGGSACNGVLTNCVETITNVMTPPTRTQCGSTITSGTSEATIQSAMNACKPGSFLLTANNSTFSFSTAFTWVNGVSLRLGGGSAIAMTGSSRLDMGVSGGGGNCPLTNLSSNFTVGATTFVCTTASPPAVNTLIWITQCNTGMAGGGSFQSCTGTQADNSGIFICVLSNACNQSGGTPNAGTNSSEQQNFLVTAVNANGSGGCTGGAGTFCITVNEGLYATNWAFGQSPYLAWQTGFQGGMGLEGSGTVTFTFGQDEQVQIFDCYSCWIGNGVRIVGNPINRLVGIMGNDSHTAIITPYIYAIDPNPSNFNSTGANTCIQYGQDTDTLILSPILQGCILESFGASLGDVIAYPYMRDGETDFYQNSDFRHADEFSGSLYNLVEGAEVGDTYDDNTWGTKDFTTWFRNYVSGWDPPYVITVSPNGNSRGILMNAFNRLENAVGNVISGPFINNYTVTNGGSTYGYVWAFNSADSFNQSTAMRWGNVSNVSQSSDTPTNSGIRFVSSEVPTSLTGNFSGFSNSVPGSTNLPCSFFLAAYTSTTCTAHPSGGTGLSFWKVCTNYPTCSTFSTPTWPYAGPDVTGGPNASGFAYDNPAEIAWRNLPVDSSFQHTYTITASSWAGGTETLTVSGLPASAQHVLGAFQLSGVGAGCTSGATFGNNSEVLMTGSSTTTIAYALASNPGANACTGSFLFPDVRQFSSAVFSADTSGGSVTLAPSPENFGSFTVGVGSSPVTFTITNGSSNTATSVTPSVTGGNSGDFAITNTGAGSCSVAGVSLAAAGTCTFTIVATPGAAGSRSATLSVSYGGGDSASPVTSALSVTGIAAAGGSKINGGVNCSGGCKIQ